MFYNKFTKKDSVAEEIEKIIAERWDDDDEDDDVKRADAELRRMKVKPIEADKKTDADKEIGKLAKKTPKEMDEELKGGQTKLDVAKPKGKLTAADFKKLRKEDAEQIDELSKSTLAKYMRANTKRMADPKNPDSMERKMKRHDDYFKASKKFHEDAELSEEPVTAALATLGGMVAGGLAGKKLSDLKDTMDAKKRREKGKASMTYYQAKADAYKKSQQKEELDLSEKTLTPAESKKKEEIVKSMKKGASGFKERYGKRAKEVMYATATKQAKKVAEETVSESWDKGASKSYVSDSISAIKQKKKASEHLSRAKSHPEGSVFHNDYMAKHHSAMAKYIKHAYHSAQYGSQSDAKTDYKKHMDLSKSYKSGKMDENVQNSNESYTGKGNHKPGWMLKADPALGKKLRDAKSAARPPLSSPSKEYLDKMKKEEVTNEAKGPTSDYDLETFATNETHSSPLSRVKSLAKSSMSRIKNEMLGKAGTTSEEIDPSVKSTDTLKGRVAGGKKDDVGPSADGKSTKVKFTPGPK